MRSHPSVVKHVDPERVQLGQGLSADVANKLPLGVRRLCLVLEFIVSLTLGNVGRRGLAERRSVAALLLVSCQVRAQ